MDGCWVPGCRGAHDGYLHPLHNCRPPSPLDVHAGATWACPADGCPKTWRVTQEGRPGSWGWELYELEV